ncbi:MAG: ABC1 kinase family protein [Vulcanimicrobiota bacterium]
MKPIKQLDFIGKTYKHIKRYQEIVRVVIKYGYGDLVKRLNLGKTFDFESHVLDTEPKRDVDTIGRWARVRLMIEELGPSFIKIGQILSVRPDMIPPELALELEKLQDQVPPFSGNEARKIIETELGGPVEEFFDHFDKTPLASASIAQVHRGRLKTGEEVAIKVQRPNIKETVQIDTEILYHIAYLAEKYLIENSSFSPTQLVDEFSESLEKEMDFNHESVNARRFAQNFEDNDLIRVPRVFQDYSTVNVLTLEYIKGVKINERDKIIEAGLNPRILAKRGTDLVLEQVFFHGFFHADPHSGNIHALSGNVLCFLDFGMMGVITTSLKNGLNNFIIALTLKDERKLVQSVFKLSGQRVYEDKASFEKDLTDFMQNYFYMPLKEIKMSQMFPDLLRVMDRNNVKINPQAYMLFKAFGTIEGTALELDPDLEIIKRIEPFAKKSMEMKLDPERLAQDLFWSALDLNEVLRDIPGDVKDVIYKLKKGKVDVSFEHKGLLPVLDQLGIISNRVSFSIVLASLIIGSSLVVLSNIPPKIYDIPLIGIVGYAISAVMGVWLLISIIRSGNF